MLQPGAVASGGAERTQAPFRIPVGDTARNVLAARKAAPEDTPFVAADLDW